MKMDEFFYCMQQFVDGCNLCELHKTRTKAVLGEGSLSPRVLFVGEAPGAEEDKAGRPFVGRAGKTLRKMIESAKLDNYYIMNTLCCRPPNNAKPTPSQVKACSKRFGLQVRMLEPKVIVAVGGTALEALTGQTGISHWVGKELNTIVDGTGFKVVPVFHPAYLMRPFALEEEKELTRRIIKGL